VLPSFEGRKELEDALHRGGDEVRLASTGPSGEAQVVSNRERTEHPPATGHGDESRGDAFGGRPSRHILAVEVHAPGLRAHQPAHHAEDGALAGPIGSKEGDRLACVDVQGDVEENLDLSVASVDGFAAQQCSVGDLERDGPRPVWHLRRRRWRKVGLRGLLDPVAPSDDCNEPIPDVEDRLAQPAGQHEEEAEQADPGRQELSRTV
jgi:hypothetical protein